MLWGMPNNDNNDDKIVIVHLPIDSDKDEIFRTAKNDKKLIIEINKKREILESQEIEVFDQKDNIIVTEKGYYAAFYDRRIP